MTDETANRRALGLLALSSVVGIYFGVASALRGNDSIPPLLPKDAIAVVNGKVIRTEEYQRALGMLASDKRNALTDADRVHVLNRLIEEELLIQNAITRGLVETDRTVRKVITQAMLASIVTDSASARPTEEELHAFYQENAAAFERSEVQGAPHAPVTRRPAFEDIHNQVEELYLQRTKDTALRAYLAWLRDEAEIALVAED